MKLDTILIVISAGGAPTLAIIASYLLSHYDAKRAARKFETAAETAAENLRRDTRTVTNKLEATVRASGEKTDKKLREIHTLVNGQLLAALTGELAALDSQVATLFEMSSMKRASGSEPSEEALAMIAAAEERITELRQAIEARTQT